MRREPRTSLRAAAAALAAALLASGCVSSLFNPPPPPPAKPVIDRKAASAEALADDLDLLEKLIAAPPQQQMEMIGTAEEALQRTPTPNLKLRLALVLGTPGQAGSDLPRARNLLRELAADPSSSSSLLPAERSLASLELKQIGDYLTLEQENRTLQADAARAEQLVALKRRLDGAAVENEKLKRQLVEARAKLAAIANIEKSLNERKPGRPK